MSCLVWNCCGLRNPCTGNKLVDMVRAKDPSVVFLAEIWADEAGLKDVKRKIKFESMFVLPRMTRGGRLVLFWRSSIDISVKGFDKNHIDRIINKNKENE